MNIKIKKGKIYLLQLLFVAFIFSSCNDDSFLEEDALDFLTIDNTYNTPDGILTGINGLHSTLRSDFFALDVLYFTNYTDEAYSGESPGGDSFADNIVPDGDKPESYWEKAYQIIQQTNILLAAIDEIDEDDWTSDDQKEAYIAEVKFFRAYAYRLLVYTFGDVPLQTEPVSTAKVDFVRDPTDSIYSQIESDLTYAAKYLPAPGEEEAAGRITQGAAWHLLSEIYLAQGKYQKSVDAATEVIDGGHYALMTSRFGTQNNLFKNENCYFDLFTKGNMNLATNTEAIWVMQFDPETSDETSYMGPRAYGCKYYKITTDPDGVENPMGSEYDGTFVVYSDTLSRPVAWASPTSYVRYKIWKSDWDNDYRNSEACIKRHYYYSNPESAWYGKEFHLSDYTGTAYDRSNNQYTDSTQNIFPYFMKVSTPCDWYTDLARAGGGYTTKNYYVFREAETYLIRAEAYLGLDRPDLAAADINTVRERSNASDVTEAELEGTDSEGYSNGIDYILDERARELYAEENRMLTLLRLGRVYDRVLKYNDDPYYVYFGINALDVEEHNNLWPIPQDVIDLNTGATIEQNPGY